MRLKKNRIGIDALMIETACKYSAKVFYIKWQDMLRPNKGHTNTAARRLMLYSLYMNGISIKALADYFTMCAPGTISWDIKYSAEFMMKKNKKFPHQLGFKAVFDYVNAEIKKVKNEYYSTINF